MQCLLYSLQVLTTMRELSNILNSEKCIQHNVKFVKVIIKNVQDSDSC